MELIGLSFIKPAIFQPEISFRVGRFLNLNFDGFLCLEHNDRRGLPMYPATLITVVKYYLTVCISEYSQSFLNL